MARIKKEGRFLNIKMDAAIYNRLEEYCLEAGLTKISAVEKGLTMLMDNYAYEKETMRKIADGSMSLVDNRKE